MIYEGYNINFIKVHYKVDRVQKGYTNIIDNINDDVAKHIHINV